MNIDGPAEPVQLVLPGTSRHIRLARLVASGVASTHGLAVERVEDARIAVDEICASLIETGQGRPVRLDFLVDDGALVIRGSTERDDETQMPDRGRLAISQRILDVLTDHQFLHVDGQAVFTVSIPLSDDATAG